jgi:heat shock 70kDa protein 1/2/6/8
LTAESGWLVGNAAKEEMNKNVKNTVYDAKRMLGKAFLHPDIQKLKENWQFQLVDKEVYTFNQIKYNPIFTNFRVFHR